MCVFGIYANFEKDRDLAVTRRVIRILESRNAEYYVDWKILNALGAGRTCPDQMVDVAIVLGGDGTMLGAARRFARHGAKLFGLNMGRVGFLLDTEIEDIESAIDSIIAGKYEVEERLMLSASVTSADGGTVKMHAYALNEAVISQREILRMIEVHIDVNGRPVDQLCCDGVIVSTPTGSTGYSLSAGGPVVMPALNVMVISPICPHTLRSNHIVISGSDVISVHPVHGSKFSTLTLDGQNSFDMDRGDVVRIEQAGFRAKFIRIANHNFFELLRNKLTEWTNEQR